MKLPAGTPCAAPSVDVSSWPEAGDQPSSTTRLTRASWRPVDSRFSARCGRSVVVHGRARRPEVSGPRMGEPSKGPRTGQETGESECVVRRFLGPQGPARGAASPHASPALRMQRRRTNCGRGPATRPGCKELFRPTATGRSAFSTALSSIGMCGALGRIDRSNFGSTYFGVVGPTRKTIQTLVRMTPGRSFLCLPRAG